MTIEIRKTLQMASVFGGDAGPGTGDPVLGLANTYNWTLPISDFEPDPSKQTSVAMTFNLVMSIIAGNAQSSCSSISLVGSGGYGSNENASYVQYSGMPTSVSAGKGQLQAIGSQIDLRDANQSNLGTDVSLLPIGLFTANPVKGVTVLPLYINITE
jgi:hypothetical protein